MTPSSPPGPAASGRALAAGAAIVLLALAGCRLPRDPEGTLERVRGGTLRVGVVESPPWIVRRGEADEPGGVEAELVRALARDLGAGIEWHWGAEQGHLEALERYELDLVAGGLTRASPWRRRVGFALPHHDERSHVGFAAARPAMGDIGGLQVAVRAGTPLVARLEKEGAVPVPVEPGRALQPPLAAGDWELAARGLVPVGPELGRARHVLAVPPGENAFLVEVERVVRRERTRIGDLLRSTTPVEPTPSPERVAGER